MNSLNQKSASRGNDSFQLAAPNKEAHAISSKYGNFDFPAIPEHETVADQALLAQRPSIKNRPESGIRATNKFLNTTDPMTTTHSIQSVNSVNLERINQRNADRLAKLENNDFQNDDSHMLTMSSLKTKQMPVGGDSRQGDAPDKEIGVDISQSRD